jgi:hypothetical protein
MNAGAGGSHRAGSLCGDRGKRGCGAAPPIVAGGIGALRFYDWAVVIWMSPEALRRAVELTRTSSCALEFWPVLDPSLTDGSREVRLAAYRALRDDLLQRLTRRFPPRGARRGVRGADQAIHQAHNARSQGQIRPASQASSRAALHATQTRSSNSTSTASTITLRSTHTAGRRRGPSIQWPTRAEVMEFVNEMGAGLLLIVLLCIYALGAREVLEFVGAIPILGWILVR